MNYPVINTVATGKRIKELCRRNNISVNEVKEFMGFENPQAIYKWLRGESLPSLDNFYALSRLLNVPLDSLIISVENLGGFSTDSFFICWVRGRVGGDIDPDLIEARMIEYMIRFGYFVYNYIKSKKNMLHLHNFS